MTTCPSCRSTDVRPALLVGDGRPDYVCRHCSHGFELEVVTEADDLVRWDHARQELVVIERIGDRHNIHH